jgi:hypothetical protein
MVKRCLFCGRYFTPDYRVKDRQKSCCRPECRKARKKSAQENWVKKNPDYFADVYETYVKPCVASQFILTNPFQVRLITA